MPHVITGANGLLERAYHLYQKNWCELRDYNLEDWDEEMGFAGGESFVCLSEFAYNEFLDPGYMDFLLTESDFALWNAWQYAPEIVVEVSGGMVQSVYSTNPFIEVRIADQDILENGPEEDEVEALRETEKRSKMPDMHMVY